MKRHLIAILGMLAIAESANASLGFGGTFGTQFVCCTSQVDSCLDGSGATVWQKNLYDHALTQVDAQARCGFEHMFWNSSSCPADTPCGNPSPGVPHPIIPPPPTTYNATIYNAGSQAVFLALDQWKGTMHIVNSWYQLNPGASQTLSYLDEGCIAVSQNGQDWIAAKRNSGSIITGTILNLAVNPTDQTSYSYGIQGGSYWANISVTGVTSGSQPFSNLTSTALSQIFTDYGMRSFQCLYTRESFFQPSVGN